MTLSNGRITILFSGDGLKIEVTDDDASITFCEIKLNQEQTCQALSRLSHTPCEVGVWGLGKVGKKMEHMPFSFKIPKEEDQYGERKDNARRIAKEICPEGWEPDLYFGSQSSFIQWEGETIAKTTIRRWV